MPKKKRGSVISTSPITKKSTPRPTSVVNIPDLTTVLSMPIIFLYKMKSPSMITEKLVCSTSQTTPKETSLSMALIVMKKLEKLSIPSTSASVENAGMKGVPPLSSLRRRAVAGPKTNVALVRLVVAAMCSKSWRRASVVVDAA